MMTGTYPQRGGAVAGPPPLPLSTQSNASTQEVLREHLHALHLLCSAHGFPYAVSPQSPTTHVVSRAGIISP